MIPQAFVCALGVLAAHEARLDFAGRGTAVAAACVAVVAVFANDEAVAALGGAARRAVGASGLCAAVRRAATPRKVLAGAKIAGLAVADLAVAAGVCGAGVGRGGIACEAGLPRALV